MYDLLVKSLAVHHFHACAITSTARCNTVLAYSYVMIRRCERHADARTCDVVIKELPASGLVKSPTMAAIGPGARAQPLDKDTYARQSILPSLARADHPSFFVIDIAY